MKAFKVFLNEARDTQRNPNFKPKPFKIEGLTFKPVDRGIFSFTAMDHEYVSDDNQWKIIPGGYKEGVGAQTLNRTKAGKVSTKLTWSIWNETDFRLLHTFGSLPKAKKGIKEIIIRRKSR